MPPRTRMRLDLVCGLGGQGTGRYALPRAAPQALADLPCDPLFASLSCVVITSTGTGPAVFYLDNLDFGPLEKLAQD